MTSIFDAPLAHIAAALRARDISAVELLGEALRRHDARTPALGAYKLLDREGAAQSARRADALLARGEAGPLCGIPISVKDLYGVEGLDTYAGTARVLPPRWSKDGWLVARLRAQGAVFTGKTHTVELAYGAVGIDPHWGTPRNPHDDQVLRIPGGSSAGAGVSLVEGSALVALGTDTGGSIRIPASLTGTVGHKTTQGRWPTDGVVPLSSTLDSVGALTRSVADSAWFFGAVDPEWGDPEAFMRQAEAAGGRAGDGPIRIALPRCDIWRDTQGDIARVLEAALQALTGHGFTQTEVDGSLLDRAESLYMTGAIAGAECRAFLAQDLPEWIDILDPLVAERLRGAPSLDSQRYVDAQDARRRLTAEVESLFGEADLLVLPGHMVSAPAVADLEPLHRYVEVNAALLRPTCPVSMLGLCAVTFPVGFDEAGLPVGLQLVARGGEDARLLALGRRVEGVLG